MNARIEIAGQKELLKKLKELPENVSGKYLEDAALAGAEIIRQEASNKAPWRTGRLVSSIIKETEEKSKSSVTVAIGPKKEVFYGFFVEYGTSKMRAQPFLRPALDGKKSDAEKAVIDALKRRLGL